jgi:hypothetical protein
MNAKKKYSGVHFGAFLIMSVYLFIVIAHLFFAPNFRDVLNSNHDAILKQNTSFFYYLVRNDRSASGENKSVKIFPRNRLPYSISLLTNQNPLLTKVTDNANHFQFLPDRHHSYLPNRSIRI